MHPVLYRYDSDHVLMAFMFFYYVATAACAVVFGLEMERRGWSAPRVPFFMRWLPDVVQNSIWFGASWLCVSFLIVGFLGAHVGFGISQTLLQGWGNNLSLIGWGYLLYINVSGTMWFGGLIAGLFWPLYFSRRMKIGYLQFLDSALIGVAAAQGIARIGCLMGGCCFGKPSSLPWAFAQDSSESLKFFPAGTPLHPSQLYEFAVGLAIAAYLWRKRTKLAYDGNNAVRYFILSGVGRFLTEIVRYDTPRGVYFDWLSVSQVVGLTMAAFGIALHFKLSRKKEADVAGAICTPS